MDFVGKRKIWFTISLLLIIPGIIAMFMFDRPLNLGIDFTGGTVLTLEFNQKVSTGEVRDVLAEFNRANSTILESGAKDIIVKTEFLNNDERDKIVKKLDAEIGQVRVKSEDNVGPVIGKELAVNAITALGIASLLIVAYVTFRFEFKFAIAAIIALLHDVLVAVSLFAIFRWEVDSSFVAAILTIIGYSINDTIVIFDRIRENMNKKRHNESLQELINNSITQTLTRSINTTMTVLVTLIALFIFGGANIRNFTLCLLIGVISGCYSTIFNASPIWYMLKQREGKKTPKAA